MNPTKRAILFLSRKKSKTIILLVILTIIATLVLTCLSISRASSVAERHLRETIGGYFKIETDYEQRQSQPVTDTLINRVMEAGGIKAVNGMDTFYLLTDKLELEPGRFTAKETLKHTLPDSCNTDSSLHEYFYLRSFTLVEGRHITSNDTRKAMISDVLAQRNGLSIGDTITASFSEEQISENPEMTDLKFIFKVVGIFETNSAKNTSTQTAECDMAENFIFTDTASARALAKAMTGQDINTYKLGASFFVEDPKELDNIVAGLSNIPGYDWEAYTVTKNNKAYNDSATPLERMSGLISIMLLVIIVVSVVLLSLILTMWMRDRIHEIGVFLSIGLKKVGIIGQHILENLLVAMVAFILAWGISALAAEQVGDVLLGDVLEQTEVADETDSAFQLYSDPVKQDEIQTKELVTIQVGIGEFLGIVGIGVLIVVVSTGISSVLVIRMKPKDILSSMS